MQEHVSHLNSALTGWLLSCKRVQLINCKWPPITQRTGEAGSWPALAGFLCPRGSSGMMLLLVRNVRRLVSGRQCRETLNAQTGRKELSSLPRRSTRRVKPSVVFSRTRTAINRLKAQEHNALVIAFNVTPLAVPDLQPQPTPPVAFPASSLAARVLLQPSSCLCTLPTACPKISLQAILPQQLCR